MQCIVCTEEGGRLACRADIVSRVRDWAAASRDPRLMLMMIDSKITMLMMMLLIYIKITMLMMIGSKITVRMMIDGKITVRSVMLI